MMISATWAVVKLLNSPALTRFHINHSVLNENEPITHILKAGFHYQNHRATLSQISSKVLHVSTAPLSGGWAVNADKFADYIEKPKTFKNEVLLAIVIFARRLTKRQSKNIFSYGYRHFLMRFVAIPLFFFINDN